MEINQAQVAVQKRIAIMLIGVSNDHCGGAERFFCDFFSRYTGESSGLNNQFQVSLLTDKATKKNLGTLGKLRTTRNVRVLVTANNRFKRLLESADFLCRIAAGRYDLVLVASYTNYYYDRLRALRFLPAFIRPRLSLAIVDCEVPHILRDRNSPRFAQYEKKYISLFRTVEFDSVMTWYREFVSFANVARPFLIPPLLRAISTRYADIENNGMIASEKQPVFVWAARMTPQKQPLMLLKAINILKGRQFDFGDWRFDMYGAGPLAAEVSSFISENALSGVVRYCGNQRLDEVYAQSSCFISTQDYENYPSLSMMEAMCLENAIIARNVGETPLLVHDGKNGLLLKDDSESGLAEQIAWFISHPDLHKAMQKHSRFITEHEHTYPRFKAAIEQFWSDSIETTGRAAHE